MVVTLPGTGRPLNFSYRKCSLGVDLPSSFMYDIWSLDENIYPIFHPYRILWDDVANDYVGELADPRYSLQENSSRAGELIMGHILTNGKDEPTPDGTWHLWRYCSPVSSWAHVIAVESKDPLYLKMLVKRLWLQAKYNDLYGHRGYQRMMELADEEAREKIMSDRAELQAELNKANNAMVSRAMENFASGRVAATNPQKEIITSGAGLSNRSKIVRPLEDHEGGLIGIDDL